MTTGRRQKYLGKDNQRVLRTLDSQDNWGKISTLFTPTSSDSSDGSQYSDHSLFYPEFG